MNPQIEQTLVFLCRAHLRMSFCLSSVSDGLGSKTFPTAKLLQIFDICKFILLFVAISTSWASIWCRPEASVWREHAPMRGGRRTGPANGTRNSSGTLDLWSGRCSSLRAPIRLHSKWYTPRRSRPTTAKDVPARPSDACHLTADG